MRLWALTASDCDDLLVPFSRNLPAFDRVQTPKSPLSLFSLTFVYFFQRAPRPGMQRERLFPGRFVGTNSYSPPVCCIINS